MFAGALLSSHAVVPGIKGKDRAGGREGRGSSGVGTERGERSQEGGREERGRREKRAREGGRKEGGGTPLPPHTHTCAPSPAEGKQCQSCSCTPCPSPSVQGEPWLSPGGTVTTSFLPPSLLPFSIRLSILSANDRGICTTCWLSPQEEDPEEDRQLPKISELSGPDSHHMGMMRVFSGGERRARCSWAYGQN